MFEMVHCTYNKTDIERFSVSRPHGEDFYIFIHFLNPVNLKVNDNHYRTSGNSFILFSPNTPHYYESISHLELSSSFFYFQASDDFLHHFRIPYNQIISIPFPNLIEDYMMKLFSYVVEQNPLQAIEERATVELLFSYLSKMINRKKTSPAYEQTSLMNHVRLTIFSNVAYDWTAESIAQLTNLSVPQFYKAYKKIFQVSPIEDLNQYRTESAKRLLKSGYSVSDVSSMIGMNSPHYFTDFFKKRVGCTPTQYRKQTFSSDLS